MGSGLFSAAARATRGTGEVLRIAADDGHFEAPRGLTRSGARAILSDGHFAAIGVRACVRARQRSNNTDLSHAKCDFISSSARREAPFSFHVRRRPRRRRLCADTLRSLTPDNAGVAVSHFFFSPLSPPPAGRATRNRINVTRHTYCRSLILFSRGDRAQKYILLRFTRRISCCSCRSRSAVPRYKYRTIVCYRCKFINS